MIGTVLNDRYRLEAELGRGGMGIVYRAHDAALDRDVAIKVIRPDLDPIARLRFVREARLLARLNHPHIVAVYDVGEADQSPYLVMELVQGASLGDCPPREMDEIIAIGRQVCAALHHAHSQGMVHRDLKPENVLLSADGTAKLMDLGLARLVDSGVTSENVIMGTPRYLAPEIVRGEEPDGRTDLYALGVMLYEFTTGQPPFSGETAVALLAQHLHAPVAPPREKNPAIPPALDALIVRLMSKQPADRPASAAEVLGVLDQLGAAEVEAAVVAPEAEVGVKPVRPAFLEGSGPEARAPIFVGREGELARLDGFLARALAGEGGVAFVTGGPGRGKTALLEAFGRRAMAAHPDLLVASGDCNAYSGIGDPYLPFRAVMAMLTGEVEARWAAGAITREHAFRLWGAAPLVLRGLVEQGPSLVDVLVPRSSLLALCGDVAPPDASWLPKLKRLARQRRAALDGLGQSHVFQQFTNLLTSLACEHPLLLMLDDLQWADDASISLLFHLGRSLQAYRILVLGAYRPEEVALGRPPLSSGSGERHPLEKALAELKRQFGDVWVDLTAADQVAGRQFVDAFLETEPNRLEEAFRSALFQHTGGHPLFTVELLRAMQERGGLIQDEDCRWIAVPKLDWATLPTRVEGVIEERIGRLEEELREILTVASVEGEDFTAQVVARVQDMGERELLRQLTRQLEKRHRLVRELGEAQVGHRTLSRFRFAHTLFQHHLYHGLSAGECRLLHRAVAAVLEELWEGRTEEIAVQLARHYAGDPQREQRYARLAGEQAAAQYANAEALRYLSRALELTPAEDHAERYAILLTRERVHNVIGERSVQAQELARLGELADALDEDGKRAEIALRRSAYARVTGHYQSALAAAEESVILAQELGDRAGEAQAQLAWGAALARQGDYESAWTHLDVALALANSVGLPELAARVLQSQGMVSFHQGDHAGARRFFEQTLSNVRRTGNRLAEAGALSNLGAVAGDQGDLPAALGHFRQSLVVYRELGSRIGEGVCLNNLGVVARDLGDYRAAQGYLERALAVHGEIGNRQGQVHVLSELGFVKRNQGDYAGARTDYERSLAIAREINARRGEAYALTGLGDCLTGLGNWGEAISAYRQAIELRDELGQPHLVMESRAGLARAAMAQGDLIQARNEVEAIIAYLDAGDSLEGADAPLEVCLTCYRVLRAGRDARAEAVLVAAHDLLQGRAGRISDDESRRSYVQGVAVNREISQEYATLRGSGPER